MSALERLRGQVEFSHVPSQICLGSLGMHRDRKMHRCSGRSAQREWGVSLDRGLEFLETSESPTRASSSDDLSELAFWLNGRGEFPAGQHEFLAQPT
jgi:hypothetical protein